jgi:endoglycosylceramidase
MQLRLSIVGLVVLFSSCKKQEVSSSSDILLHSVRGSNPGIYDALGRYILLRGVNYNALGDYWQGNPNIPTTKQYDPEDIRMIASYGINCIRLLFHWSKLEPQRGVYNYEYMRQIQEVIEEAAKYNIYILLDMHQDAWGKYIVSSPSDSCANPNKGWDGAPQWATLTDNAATCINGGRETAPAVFHAFENFWNNTDGINDACIKAWQELVKNTAQYPNVAGYDLINEPNLGYKALNEEGRMLGTYYDKLIKGIRSAEESTNGLQHIIFFEMSVTLAGEGIPFIPFPDFTSEKNIIFSPHLYFEAISNQLTIEQGFDLVKVVSKLFNTSMFIGEWGFFGDPATDVSKVKRFALQEDKLIVGSTWWQWSQAPGDPHGISWDGMQYGNTSMALIELDKYGHFTGNVNTPYLEILSRSRPLAVCGTPRLLTSNPVNGTLHLEAKTSTEGITVLWIPDRFGEPRISGNNVRASKVTKVEGGYHAEINVSGNYSVDIGF